MAPTAPMHAGRRGQLDSLRAIAATTVIAAHSISSDTEAGSYAVYFFFVLSAFLITSLLHRDLAEARISGAPKKELFKSFYWRRARRILPAYYLCIFVAYAVGVEHFREEFPYHLFHMSNALFALDPKVGDHSWAGHFWSLSVEEQFYLFWPPIVLLTSRRIQVVCALGMVLAGVYAWYPNHSLPEVVERLSVLDSLDCLGVGVLLAFAAPYLRTQRWVTPLGILSALLCAALLYLKFASDAAESARLVLSHEIMLVAFAVLVLRAEAGFKVAPLAWVLISPALQYLGRISYGLYLYHTFVNAMYWQVSEALGLPYFDYGKKLFVVVYVGTILVASASWRWVEKPLLTRRAPRMQVASQP